MSTPKDLHRFFGHSFLHRVAASWLIPLAADLPIAARR